MCSWVTVWVDPCNVFKKVSFSYFLLPTITRKSMPAWKHNLYLYFYPSVRILLIHNTSLHQRANISCTNDRGSMLELLCRCRQQVSIHAGVSARSRYIPEHKDRPGMYYILYLTSYLESASCAPGPGQVECPLPRQDRKSSRGRWSLQPEQRRAESRLVVVQEALRAPKLGRRFQCACHGAGNASPTGRCETAGKVG